MHLKITDFSAQKKLNEAILRYYTLLRMSFETNIYKIFETVDSQIYRFFITPSYQPPDGKPMKVAEIKFECPKCNEKFLIQANLEKNISLRKDHIPYPIDNDVLKCPNGGIENNISNIRLQIEAQSNKKIVK